MLDAPEPASRTSAFDATTLLVPDETAADMFAIGLDPAWSSLVGVHGGYLAAIAIKAAQTVAGNRPVRTATTHFLRPGAIGPASVSVEVVRTGRSITNLTVAIAQGTKDIVVSYVTAADDVESTRWELPVDVGLPPIEQCVPITPPPGIGHFDHGVVLLDPADLPFSHGPRARVAGYMRPIEAHPIDAPWIGMALDWFPPASFTRIDPPAGGISLSYTVHIHRTLDGLGEDQWLGGVFHADISVGGIALEKGLLTGPDGRVIAESFHTRWTAGPNQLAT